MKQALTGIKILDLSRGIAGAYCTRLLAGFGAEVIKIEKPGRGDTLRSIRPFNHDLPGVENSGLFLYLNTGKKSVTLDLLTETGIKIFKELAFSIFFLSFQFYFNLKSSKQIIVQNTKLVRFLDFHITFVHYLI